jgi:hypothetical protein
MLSNRFFRLITTAILFIVSLLIGALLLVPYCEDLNGIGLAVLGAFAIGVAHQICWDFLDLGFLDNGFGKLLKRLIFLAVFVIVGFLATYVYFDEMIVGKEWEELNFLGKAFAGSVGYVPILTAGLCVVSSLQDWEKEKAPFIPLMALGGGIAIAAVAGLIGGALLKIVPIVLLVGGIVGLIYYMIKNEFIYEDGCGGYSRGSSRSYSRGSSSSGGSSYSSGSRSSYSSGSRSSSSSGSRSYSSSSSSSYTTEDSRKKDGVFLNQFSIEMNRIARGCSTIKDLAYGVSMNVEVRASSSPTSVNFTIDAVLYTSRCTATCEADLRAVASDRDRVLQDVADSLYNNAESSISRLRDEYQGYDKAVRINVKVGNIRTN